MFAFSRALCAFLLTNLPAERILRFLAKSAVNAENHDLRWNGEGRALRQMLARLPEDCVVYDVGANVGDWSRAVLDLKPNCRLHAFEMIPSLAEAARARIGDRVHAFGLSDHAFETTAFQYDQGALLTENSFHAKQAQRVPVKVLRGDELDLPPPQLMKIDVEGHELKVLRGFERTIRAHRPIIQFEYGIFAINERVLLRDLFEALDGYDIHQIMPTRLVKRDYAPALENFWTVNYLAIPRG